MVQVPIQPRLIADVAIQALGCTVTIQWDSKTTNDKL